MQEYHNKNDVRPFDSKFALHIVLRSEIAKGEFSMATNRMRSWIQMYVPLLAQRLGVRLYHASNNGNHLHLLAQFPSKSALNKFLRTVCGMIARRALNAEKGAKSKVKFWTKRPYSRLVTWGKEFLSVVRYVHRNYLESRGIIPYIEREKKLPEVIEKYIAESWNQNKIKIQSALMGQLSLNLVG